MKLLLFAVIAVAVVLIPTLPRTLVCFYPAKNQGQVHCVANAMLALSEEETFRFFRGEEIRPNISKCVVERWGAQTWRRPYEAVWYEQKKNQW